MPLEYKVYGCMFKCGTKHRKSFSLIAEHEKICWSNPDNRTCVTCKYGEIEHEYDPHDEMESCPSESYRYRVCNFSDEQHNILFERNENIKLQTEDEYVIALADIKPLEHCEKWENKHEI